MLNKTSVGKEEAAVVCVSIELVELAALHITVLNDSDIQVVVESDSNRHAIHSLFALKNNFHNNVYYFVL